jgi:hypothetical protein
MPPLTALVEPSSLHDFERRLAERHPSKREALTRPLEAEVTLAWGASVRDISTSGIGLTLCYPFPAGTYLTVDLDLPESAAPAPSWLARVVHAQDQPDGTWHVGCEFVKPLSEGELDFVV